MLRVTCYEAGSGGAPTTTYLATIANQHSYQHTIGAKIGFESMSVALTGTLDTALFWINNLMCGAVVYGPEAQICWEGFLSSIDCTFGQRSVSISLDKVANRVYARYTTTLGNAGITSAVSDAVSVARYGRRDAVLLLSNSIAAAAAADANKELARRSDPMNQISSTIATGEIGDIEIRLGFSGWYTTLGLLLTSNTSTTNTATTTQVGTLLTTVAAVNAFISTATNDIVASGISDTEFIDLDTSYRQKIEELLGRGNSSNERLAWGVYENRRFRVRQWAGATPTVVTYRQFLGLGQLLNDVYGIVQPWDVRPDAMCQIADFAEVTKGATELLSRFYIERVTCTISASQIGVTLEPQASDSFDAVLSRVR